MTIRIKYVLLSKFDKVLLNWLTLILIYVCGKGGETWQKNRKSFAEWLKLALGKETLSVFMSSIQLLRILLSYWSINFSSLLSSLPPLTPDPVTSLSLSAPSLPSLSPTGAALLPSLWGYPTGAALSPPSSAGLLYTIATPRGSSVAECTTKDTRHIRRFP